MFLSDKVVKNLELDDIFSRIIVYTPYGKTCKKEMKPYLRGDKERLVEEYHRIQQIVGLIEKHRYTFVEMRNIFKAMKDLRGSFKRIEEDEILSTIELFEIKIFAGQLQKLAQILQNLSWNMPQTLSVQPMPELIDLLDPQKNGTNTFYIYDEYSDCLKNIRREMKEIETKLIRRKTEIKDKIQKELNVKIRPNGEITVNKSNKEMLDRIEAHKELVYSFETYMNITYRIKTDDEMDKWMEQLEGLKAKEEEEEFRIRQWLTGEIKKVIDQLYWNTMAIGNLDLLVAKGYLAIGMNATRPRIVEEERVNIVGGRHIKVEEILRKQGKKFTPITVALRRGVTCITGANMGGKTVSLKLIGILSAMAQYGLFVPAEQMEFSLRDYIFASLGDQQSVDRGLSTFGAEVLEIKEIMERADEHGLILVDELARGTNPAEGYAISKAIISYLKNRNTITVITTHFDGLTEDEDIQHLQVKGLAEVDYERIKTEMESRGILGIEGIHQYMDYRLIVVKSQSKVPQDAIHIARLMGLQEEILKEAENYLRKNPIGEKGKSKADT